MSPKIFKIDCLSLSNKPVNLYEKCKGKVSIVTFEFAASGEQHVKTFIDKMSADLVANSSKLQHIRVNVEEIWTKTGVAKMMRYFIRRKVPEQHHDNYLSYFSSIEQMRRAVGISNRLIGWVLLVDSKGLIRWMANGPATEKEIETLRRFIK